MQLDLWLPGERHNHVLVDVDVKDLDLGSFLFELNIKRFLAEGGNYQFFVASDRDILIIDR